MHLDFPSYQFRSFNLDIRLWIPFFFPADLFGRFSLFGLMLVISSGVSNDNDLVDFWQGVHVVETHFDSLVAPTAVYTNLVQELNQVCAFCLKICLLHQQLRARIVISVHADHDLKRTVDLSVLQSVIQSGKRFLNHVFHLVEYTLHRRRSIQSQDCLANQIPDQRLFIELVNLLYHFLHSLALCIKPDGLFVAFVCLEDSVLDLFELLVPFVVVGFLYDLLALLDCQVAL
jgi:hypothetical protein